MSIVGAVSYPAPAESKVKADNLPVCSSNTGVTVAGVVGSSVGDLMWLNLHWNVSIS